MDSLPDGAEWSCKTIEVEGDIVIGEEPDPENPGKMKKVYETEELELWFRDINEVIREIIGNPDFREYLRYAPERLFTNESKDEEVINEMATAEWWWETQVREMCSFTWRSSIQCLTHSGLTDAH